jgi:thiamine biosynthesis lipoprotein
MGYAGFLFFLLIAFPYFSHSNELFKFHQVSMGTVVEISLIGENQEKAEKAVLQAFREIRRIEQLMSPKIEKGDVFRINQSAGKEWIEVSPETLHVVKKSIDISELSEGGFDITVGPLIELWRKARGKGYPPSEKDLKKSLGLVGFRKVLINQEGKIFLKESGMSIDLGGIAKGYAVDKAFELLNNLGYRNLIVNAGGDLRAGGLKWGQPWSIGIQDPRIPDKILGKVSFTEGTIATSGDYEKYFMYQGKRYHHILNPRNGLPAEKCQSVTIFYKDGMISDAFSTTVFVLGPEKGYSLCQRERGMDCLIVDKEGKIILSPGLKDRISFIP